MAFKFTVRQALASDAQAMLPLTDAYFKGSEVRLAEEISFSRDCTYWLAEKDGKILGCLRARALGAGAVRLIGAEWIALSDLRESGFDAAQVLRILLRRSLGDMPALACFSPRTGFARQIGEALDALGFFLCAGASFPPQCENEKRGMGEEECMEIRIR